MKRIISLIVAILVSVCFLIPAFAADSNVEYNNAGNIIFNPTDKDLFQDFKGVMPGDKVEQKIVINNTKSTNPVTVYLKAEIDEEYKDFLSQMDLEVYISPTDTVEDRKLLQSGLASETGKLAIEVPLGTFQPNELNYLTVVLSVHSEMDNEYKDCVGKIKWIFSAEEGDTIVTFPSNTIPVVEPTTVPDGEIIGEQDNPKTSVTYVAGGIAIGVIAIAVVVFIIINKKPKESDDK